MIKKVWMLLFTLFTVLVFLDMANAGLTKIGTATYEGKDYNLIYEDDQGLIWLDYSHPAQRSGGPWFSQMKWAAGLNDSGVLTYNFNTGIKVSWQGSWRLPLTVDGARKWGYDGSTTAGFNIATSEMGHLFYKSLENIGYYDTKGKPRPGWGKSDSQHEWGLKNKGPFENLQADACYYSGTPYGPNPKDLVWIFNMYYGSQFQNRFIGTTTIPALAVCNATVSGR
jgi:hypothetical protein